MPSLAYARDLSQLARGYAAGPTCNGVPCTMIPSCEQAHACISQCGPGVIQNCGSRGDTPAAGLLNAIGGGANNAGESVYKGAGAVGKGFQNLFTGLTAPCSWGQKVPVLNAIPCWLTYILIVLGLVVLIKH